MLQIEKIGNKLVCDTSKTCSRFDDIVDDKTQKIREAIEKKIKKNYQANTLLIISGICNGGYEDKDKRKIQSVLDESSENIFSNIFFVDLNKQVFLTKHV